MWMYNEPDSLTSRHKITFDRPLKPMNRSTSETVPMNIYVVFLGTNDVKMELGNFMCYIVWENSCYILIMFILFSFILFCLWTDLSLPAWMVYSLAVKLFMVSWYDSAFLWMTFAVLLFLFSLCYIAWYCFQSDFWEWCYKSKHLLLMVHCILISLLWSLFYGHIIHYTNYSLLLLFKKFFWSSKNSY